MILDKFPTCERFIRVSTTRFFRNIATHVALNLTIPKNIGKMNTITHPLFI